MKTRKGGVMGATTSSWDMNTETISHMVVVQPTCFLPNWIDKE